jgi:hypothetical protein
MEHRINRSSDESDACLAVTALVVVLALVFGGRAFAKRASG